MQNILRDSSRANILDKTRSGVIVVCRYNQARSVFSALNLSRKFPDKLVSSCGVQADSTVSLPREVANLAEKWGYDLSYFKSRNLESITKDEARDSYFILAEKEFAYNLNSLNFTNLGYAEFQSLNLPSDLVAVDPTKSKLPPDSSFEVEVSKAIFCSSMISYQEIKLPTFFEISYYPKNEDFLIDSLDYVIRNRPTDSVVVNLDFRFNSYDTSRDDLNPIEWNGSLEDMKENVIPHIRLENGLCNFISPAAESVEAIKLLNSDNFIQSLRLLSSKYSLASISAPLRIRNLLQAESILSLSYSSCQVEIQSSTGLEFN